MNFTHIRLIDSFMDSSLRESIYPLSATEKGKPLMTECVGILITERSGNLTLQVTGRPEVSSIFQSFFKPTGVVLKTDDQVKIEGTIAGNVFFKTRLLNFRPPIGMKESQSKLVAEPTSITLLSQADETDMDQQWIIQGYLTAVPEGIFTTFGEGETSKPNKLELDLAELTIKLTDFSERNKFVQIQLKDNNCEWNYNLVAGAFLYTLSTIAGKRIEWRCLSIREGAQIRSDLFIHKSREGEFYQLVDTRNLSKDLVKRLAERIFRYYLQHGDCAVGYFLGQCWDFTSFDFPIRQLTLGVAIEGIASAAVAEKEKRGIYYQQLQCQLGNFIDENLIDPLSRTDAEQDPDRLIKIDTATRLKNVVMGSYELSGKELIKRAFQSVEMTATKEELKAWSDMRNNHAHGNVVFKDLTQDDWQRYILCVGLLNRLVIGLFGCHEIIAGAMAR